MFASSGAVRSFLFLLLTGAIFCLGGLLPGSVRAQEATGSLDPAFAPGGGSIFNGEYAGPYALALQPDGKLLVGGFFSSYNNVVRPGLVRLNADGGLDEANFIPNTAITAVSYHSVTTPGVDSIVLQPDGKILALVLSSVRTDVSNLYVWTLLRLNADGSPDEEFVRCKSHARPQIALQPDGKIVLVFGKVLYFDGYIDPVTHQIVYDGKRHANNGPATHVVRLNTDGSRDPTFASGLLADNDITALAVQPDGKILLGGAFRKIAGTHARQLARLNADGSPDPTFQARTAKVKPSVYAFPAFFVVQPDGKILTGGTFTGVDGAARAGFAMLNADGSLDTGFNPSLLGRPGSDKDGAAGAAVQGDGKVIVVGAFKTADGAARRGIARLNADGSLDGSFDPGKGIKGKADSVVVQPDGKVIIGGSFTRYDGVLRLGVARLQ